MDGKVLGFDGKRVLKTICLPPLFEENLGNKVDRRGTLVGIRLSVKLHEAQSTGHHRRRIFVLRKEQAPTEMLHAQLFAEH